jgi:hypothetical protein
MDVRKMEERKNGIGKISIIGIVLVLLTVSLSGCGEKLKPEINTDTQGAAVLPGLDEGQEKNESPPVEQHGQVRILFESFYYSLGDQYNIKTPELYGEIQNTGETWIVVNSIAVSRYGEYDKSDGSKGYYFIDKCEVEPEIGLLEPGQKSPFSMIVSSKGLGAYYSRGIWDCHSYEDLQNQQEFTWNVSFSDTATTRNKNIEIRGIQEKFDYWHRVDGFIVNICNLVDRNTGGWIIATFYNNEGRVIGFDSNTFNLRPNEVTSTSVDAIVGYSDYSLQLMT